MEIVSGSCIPADTQANLVGLVCGLVDTWHSGRGDKRFPSHLLNCVATVCYKIRKLPQNFYSQHQNWSVLCET